MLKHIRRHGIATLILAIAILPTILQAQTYRVLASGSSELEFTSNSDDSVGIHLQVEGSNDEFSSAQPAILDVIAGDEWRRYVSGYQDIQSIDNGYILTATITTEHGSRFEFTDTVETNNGLSNGFLLKRTVNVLEVSNEEHGFSTQFTLSRPSPSSIIDDDFFVPSVWYQQNQYVNNLGLASDLSDTEFWFREDRLPLPLFAIRNRFSGTTLSVFHHNAEGSTFLGEDGLDLIVDERLQFASVGMNHHETPDIGIRFPGTEGQRTGIYGFSPVQRTALRAHPIKTEVKHQYELAFSLANYNSYAEAVKDTWQQHYTLQSPELYPVNLNDVFDSQMSILKDYWQSINGSAGLPFRIKLDGTVESHLDYTFTMGFVGQQTGNAALLIREGINKNDATAREKGRAIIDFWVNEGLNSPSHPRTWYDPHPKTWRNNYATHLRVLGDGLSGILTAWNYEMKAGVNQHTWLSACLMTAQWLKQRQNIDGSFPQQYSVINGNVVNDSRNNTSNVVPFLVDLYMITGDEQYREMALKAGEFIFSTTHQNYHYAGGAADNPNILDKESASIALRAFLALYDLNKEPRWLTAALQTAYYYQSWVYIWPVPIPQEDNNALFPKHRNVTGLSVIATSNNAADTYAGVDAFNFYRLYLYTNEPQLLHFSQLLLQNTKQFMNWDQENPLPGFAHGFMGEAMNVMIPRGHGVAYFLPWQAFNVTEPMVNIWDTFKTNSYNLSSVEALTPQTKQRLHDDYSSNRGFVKVQNDTRLESGKVYIVRSKLSQKVLEVSSANEDDGANIQQAGSLNDTSLQARHQLWRLEHVRDGLFTLRALHSDQVLDVLASSTHDSANVSQWPFLNQSNQLWLILPQNNDDFSIINLNSGKALDVEGFSLDDGANVSQYTWHNTDNQLWHFEAVSAEQNIDPQAIYRIESVHSNKVLEIDNNSQDAGANLQQNTPQHTDNQAWTFTQLDDGSMTIQARHSSQSIDVVNFSTSNTANITQWPLHFGDNQRWWVENVGDNQFEIRNKHSEKCMDVENFTTADTGNISQYECTGTNNQRWRLHVIGYQN